MEHEEAPRDELRMFVIPMTREQSDQVVAALRTSFAKEAALLPANLRGPVSAMVEGEGFLAQFAWSRGHGADELRDRLTEALREAAHKCDGDCGLGEQACYEAHPITWSGMAGGETHIDGPIKAIVDLVLQAYLKSTVRDIAQGRKTNCWYCGLKLQKDGTCPACGHGV
ncbi:hypothetical protein [Streptomyces sp. UNOC14_S4]|uniref:hypothetical protein n=1 Tax=Streptomyces sp. UNOC14_S4 TaxID=2872340 RepID=UPI001E64162C|nr:hypothetical protein [Streptomyces sp. UNOC14_S4]MCC3765988.1 hypothetical protein [Streptomyces sp. UNOC14_S4]